MTFRQDEWLELLDEHRLHYLDTRAERLHRLSALNCQDCGNPIPEKRRTTLPGVITCIECQEEQDFLSRFIN